MGIAGDTGHGRYRDMFTDLLVVDSIRGMHSTGVAFVSRFNIDQNKVLKCVGPATNLVLTKEYEETIKKSSMCIIGHNRYATKGEITVDNAHPFQFEHVVGAHNGTIDYQAWKHLHENEKYGTDSQAIYSHLNEYNLRETVNNLQGAWALTWFDHRDHTLNFLRNSKRPLHYAYSEDHTTIIWASEHLMLEFIMVRYGFKSDGKVYLSEEDKHIRWEIPFGTNEKIKGPFMTEMKALSESPKSWLAWEGEAYGARHRHSYVDNRSYAASSASSAKKVDEVDLPWEDLLKNRVDTKKFRPPYKRLNGTVIPKVLFNEYVADGCVFCDNHDIPWGEFILPLKDDLDGRRIFMCEDCYNVDENFECLQWMV